MGIKVFALPDEVPAPKVDYANFNLAVANKQEDDHRAAVKAYFIGRGWSGKNTGRILREGVADGYAEYMVVEAPAHLKGRGDKFFLVHLPYGDGYQSRNVRFLTKTEVLRRIAAEEKMQALFKASK